MLIDKLKTWDYYYQKLPLYIRNSYGTVEHFKIVFDLLVQIDVTEDYLFRYLDVMAEDYLFFINNSSYVSDSMIEEVDVEDHLLNNEALSVDNETIDLYNDSDECELLDFIAAIYGVSRTFDVSVGSVQSLHLTNSQLLLLIKQRIIQYNFDGSYKTARDFYESVGLPIYIYNTDESCHAKLYLKTDSLDIEGEDAAIYYMFLAGMFTIESMGIQYDLIAINDIDDIMLWDRADKGWNVGIWL